MLREIYRTVPLTYWKQGEHQQGLNIVYNPNFIPPYIETVYYPLGILCATIPGATPWEPLTQTAAGDTSIFFVSTMSTYWHPSWDVVAWRFDGQNGKELAKYDIAYIGEALGAFYLTTSRVGKYWQAPGGGTTTLRAFHFPKEMTILSGESKGEEEDVPNEKWPKIDHIYEFDGEPTVEASHFEHMAYFSAPFGIDEIAKNAQGKVVGAFLHPVGRGSGVSALGVWEWISGKWMYDITLPDGVIDITMEGINHAYILMANRTVVLLDYMRGEVLGSAKIPPRQIGNAFGSGSLGGTQDVRVTWDEVYKRLLVFEKTPDNPDGSSTCIIRGYRMVPEPHRVTIPIPLKAPRQRRVVPVLVQVVGDSNEGVGNYTLDAQVTGAGSLVGVPLSDHMGNTLIQVACEGSPFFAASGVSDWEETGSPEALPYPHTGLVTIVAKATVYQPDPADIPVSGAPGTPGGGTPGAPGGFIWDWKDQVEGAPAPDAPGDQSGAPGNTLGEWETYFFGLIHKTKGAPANDYEAVLQELINQGAKVNPAKGEIPTVSWPFYGLAIMVSGTPRGRIWLPTSETNVAAGGWYSHEIQVIKDAPPPVDPGSLPSEMPNMRYILEEVKASKPAGYWKFEMGDEYDKWQPDGRGAFMDEAVRRMHDVDARFGHFNKTPPHNGYRPGGGAVDAVCFKNDDGVTQEGADCIGTDITWGPYPRKSRTPDGDYNCWIYPGNPQT